MPLTGKGERKMPDREKVNGFELCANGEPCIGEKFTSCPFSPRNNAEQNCGVTMARFALALLKEQEAVVKQWTKEIADNQLAHAPNDSPMSLDEQLECEYKRGIWDGLQIAWNIISEGR